MDRSYEVVSECGNTLESSSGLGLGQVYVTLVAIFGEEGSPKNSFMPID
ncbi:MULTISPECIES: hypothetical protein [Vibrio]|nr:MULTISPECIES: hypothetical protein [Vibrio]